MIYSGSQRYQFQPRHVKAWRWARYMPLAYLRIVKSFGMWIVCGMPTDKEWADGSKLAKAQSIVMVNTSRAAMEMGHYWTSEECLNMAMKSIPLKG